MMRDEPTFKGCPLSSLSADDRAAAIELAAKNGVLLPADPGDPEDFDTMQEAYKAALENRRLRKLEQHFCNMQTMMRAYLTPGPYTSQDGAEEHDLAAQDQLFIEDMLYMLDGPEQREAQK